MKNGRHYLRSKRRAIAAGLLKRREAFPEGCVEGELEVNSMGVDNYVHRILRISPAQHHLFVMLV